MTVRVETSKYENSNGKAPKGFGAWWFEANGQMFEFTGSYGEAKKAAVKWAKAQGAMVVKVQA